LAGSTSLTPAQRAQRARIAADAMHAQGKTNVTPARSAFEARFEREVDPDGVLSPEERAKRARHAMKAHMTRMAFASSKARARKKAS
jgi:hypothetical protein